MANTIPAYVLDSFALLAYFQAEAGGPRVRELLEAARDNQLVLHLSLINAGEMYYLLSREQGRDRAEDMLQDLRELPITLQPATEQRIFAAARVKAQHPLSYADAFAAALAQELGASIVTGDPEFKTIEGTITVQWLPTGSPAPASPPTPE